MVYYKHCIRHHPQIHFVTQLINWIVFGQIKLHSIIRSVALNLERSFPKCHDLCLSLFLLSFYQRIPFVVQIPAHVYACIKVADVKCILLIPLFQTLAFLIKSIIKISKNIYNINFIIIYNCLIWMYINDVQNNTVFIPYKPYSYLLWLFWLPLSSIPLS